MPTVKSCFKSDECKRLSASCYKHLEKTFDTLIKTIYMLLYTTKHLHPTFLVVYFRT